MGIGAGCAGAVSTSKGTCRFSQEEARQSDLQRFFSEGGHLLVHAPADRNDATKRLRRYASADREPITMQDVGYFSRLGRAQLR